MTQIELQKVLGDRILVALRENLSPEQRQTENEQTALIVGTAKQMINNADLILRAEKLLAQTRNLNESVIWSLIK